VDRIPVGAKFSTSVQTGPGAHPASCTVGTGSFQVVKSGWSVTLTPYPILVSLVMKQYNYTSTPPMGRTACTEPQCLYKGDPYLYLYSKICLLLYNAKNRYSSVGMETRRLALQPRNRGSIPSRSISFCSKCPDRL